MVISQIGLSSETLRGETVIVTGAGEGIGLEAARALLWLGANVVIAEINTQSGQQACARLAEEFDEGRVAFVQTDVGDEQSVRQLYDESLRRFGRVDAVINNATIAVLGNVVDLRIEGLGCKLPREPARAGTDGEDLHTGYGESKSWRVRLCVLYGNRVPGGL